MSSQPLPLEQLRLFSDEQMTAMQRPVRKRAKKARPAAEAGEPLTEEQIAAMAVVDCLRDAGYKGSDPLYDFLTGNHP